MKFKKLILTLMFCCALTFSFTACGNSDTDKSTKSTETSHVAEKVDNTKNTTAAEENGSPSDTESANENNGNGSDSTNTNDTHGESFPDVTEESTLEAVNGDDFDFFD